MNVLHAVIVVASLQWNLSALPCGSVPTWQNAPAQPPEDTAGTAQAKPAEREEIQSEKPAGTGAVQMTVEDVMHTRRRLEGLPPHGLGRWFELSGVAVGMRYRMLDATVDRGRVRAVQSSIVFRGRLKLDPSGRYSIQAGAATGSGFTGGWNNTGIGTGRATYDLFPKELSLAAQPARGLTFEVGGLYVLRGESTDTTSYDNDGYLVGERLTMEWTRLPLVDSISVTRAYLGDLDQANVFDRLRRLDRTTYYQVLAGKRLAKRVAVSGDYTWQAGTDVVRGALSLDLTGATVVDGVRFENYARVTPLPDYGYAVSLQRHFGRRLLAGGGFVDIDDQYGALGGDLGRPGRRVYASLGARLGTAWLASVQFARTLGSDTRINPRMRVDLAIGYDVLRAVASARASR